MVVRCHSAPSRRATPLAAKRAQARSMAEAVARASAIAQRLAPVRSFHATTRAHALRNAGETPRASASRCTLPHAFSARARWIWQSRHVSQPASRTRSPWFGVGWGLGLALTQPEPQPSLTLTLTLTLTRSAATAAYQAARAWLPGMPCPS